MAAREQYGKFLQTVEQWTERGERTTPWGARLICPKPDVAPEAWLHVLYRGLSKEEVARVETQVGQRLPQEYKDFLSCSNGADLFSNEIAIYGLRFSYERLGDEAWQPFDLARHNRRSERPVDRPPEVLMFASGDRANSRFFFDTSRASESSRVGKTPKERFAPAKFWPDFWTWLLEETERLARMFDDRGRPKGSTG